MEKIASSLRGIYRDVLKGPNNTVIFDSGWVSNMIVDSCRILLALLMKNNPENTNNVGGITCLRVGIGKPEWDTDGTPPPQVSLTGLEDTGTPHDVAADNLDIVYLNENDVEVSFPTTRLQITATLGTGEPPAIQPLSSYPLREFGLFGEFNGQEYMIDCIRHPRIDKDVNTTLVRTVRLYF